MLTGNLLSIGIGGIVSLTWTYLRPDNFDWEITRQMNVKGHESEILEGADITANDSPSLEKEKHSMEKVDETIQTVAVVDDEGLTTPEEVEMAGLKKAFRFAAISALSLTVVFLIVSSLSLLALGRVLIWYYCRSSFPCRCSSLPLVRRYARCGPTTY